MRQKVFIDIETFGGEKPSLDSLTADKRLKDPAKIEADLLAKQDKEWRGQALDPLKGVVYCIGYAIDGEKAECLYYEDEKELLTQFEEALVDVSYPTIIGHNLMGFDAYFLYIRALKYGMPSLVSYFSDKHGVSLVDTMLLMDGPAWKKMVSLDKMAKLFGLDGKGDISGADVHDMVLAGKTEEICNYCKSDVEILRNCYNHLVSCGVTG